MNLSTDKRDLLDRIVNDLKTIECIVAIVLGGSYATGMATEESDLDIGIYYHDHQFFNIEKIRNIAKNYALNNRFTVTELYEWGPWVNGGAWIETSSGKIDFLYRNIEQIKSTIAKAQRGECENHFEQQPPYGFSSVIYLAETQYCIPLYDPYAVIEQLKVTVQVYPQALKQTIVQDSLWSAEFTILHAEMFVNKGDVYNLVGCLARAIKNIVNALFAINEYYPIGDKRAITVLEGLKKRPFVLEKKINRILYLKENMLNDNVNALKNLFEEVVGLANNMYKPMYRFEM